MQEPGIPWQDKTCWNKVHFIREKITQGEIKIEKVPTEENPADVGIKIVTLGEFKHCLELLRVGKGWLKKEIRLGSKENWTISLYWLSYSIEVEIVEISSIWNDITLKGNTTKSLSLLLIFVKWDTCCNLNAMY